MSEAHTNTSLRIKGRLMSASEIERTLVRLAHEIVEKSNGCQGMVLVGIKRRGVPLAERLANLIATIEKCPVERGTLDIQFYRDDLSTADVRPIVTPGAIGADIVGKDVILSTTSSTPAAPSAPPSTPSSTTAARAASSFPSSSTAATASFPSRPPTSAARSPPPAARSSRSSSTRSTTTSRSSSSNEKAEMQLLAVSF